MDKPNASIVPLLIALVLLAVNKTTQQGQSVEVEPLRIICWLVSLFSLVAQLGNIGMEVLVKLALLVIINHCLVKYPAFVSSCLLSLLSSYHEYLFHV
jgi:hypothetical protein